jgi:hypothetical protein
MLMASTGTVSVSHQDLLSRNSKMHQCGFHDASLSPASLVRHCMSALRRIRPPPWQDQFSLRHVGHEQSVIRPALSPTMVSDRRRRISSGR